MFRYHYMSSETIKIEVWEKGKEKAAWIEFAEDKKRDTYKVYASEPEKDILNYANTEDYVKEQSVFLSENSQFHYLSCHRTGASDIYTKNMMEERDFGVDGEYAMAYLLKNQLQPVDTAVKDDSITNSLLEQVNYWLNYIVGTTLYVNDLKKTNYLQVKYNNNPANISSEALYCRPVNVGSGISYLISIIITCLGAEKGAVIIIENPEIHLHPRAQSRLCEFLYFVSRSGRQLFLETHSDHIFNGIRAVVATGEMEQEHIKVHFFAVNEQYETQCNPIIFEMFGEIVGLYIDNIFTPHWWDKEAEIRTWRIGQKYMIEIRANEFDFHPPHFHASSNEFSAVFKLSDGKLYAGGKKRWHPQMISEIEEWYRVHKEELKEAWDNLHGNL